MSISASGRGSPSAAAGVITHGHRPVTDYPRLQAIIREDRSWFQRALAACSHQRSDRRRQPRSHTSGITLFGSHCAAASKFGVRRELATNAMPDRSAHAGAHGRGFIDHGTTCTAIAGAMRPSKAASCADCVITESTSCIANTSRLHNAWVSRASSGLPSTSA